MKVLAGVDRHQPDRVNRNEPIPGQSDVEPPGWLLESPAASNYWAQLAPDRIRQGVLTPWDVEAFAIFCAMLAESARLIADPLYGPSSRAFHDHLQRLMPLGARFGWTPSDRSKLVIGSQSADVRERLLS